MAKKGRLKELLTKREEQLMQMLWDNGTAMSVRELVELYPEPHPHFNTVSTVVRTLEEKGFVSHEATGSSFKYYAISKREDFREKSLGEVINGYFNGSYLNAVSALVEDEKISLDELKELIKLIENNK